MGFNSGLKGLRSITKKMEKEGKRVSFLRHAKRYLVCKAWKDVSNIGNYGWLSSVPFTPCGA